MPACQAQCREAKTAARKTLVPALLSTMPQSWKLQRARCWSQLAKHNAAKQTLQRARHCCQFAKHNVAKLIKKSAQQTRGRQWFIHYISAGERMSSILRIILTSCVASWIWLRLLCRVSMTPCCFMSPAPASSMQFTPSAGFFSATCTHKWHMEEGFQKRNVEQRIMEKEC